MSKSREEVIQLLHKHFAGEDEERVYVDDWGEELYDDFGSTNNQVEGLGQVTISSLDRGPDPVEVDEWYIIHIPQEEMYLKVRGSYDSYQSWIRHPVEMLKEAKVVKPKQQTITIYE